MRALTASAAPALSAFFVCACIAPGIPGDEYELVAEPPGLQHVTPTVNRREREKSITEVYTWRLESMEWPAAKLMFVRMKDIYRGNFTFARESNDGPTLRERINIFFPMRIIELQNNGKTRNALGPVDYQRFTVGGDAQCTFIEQGISRFSDQVELISSATPIGDMHILGWYCVVSGTPYLYGRFDEFTKSIGIRGYSMP